jgi:MFS family permease
MGSLPVRAELEAFSTLPIGMLAAVYFVGFIIGCINGSRMIRRVGHIRTFAALSSIAAAMAFALAFLVDPIAWWILRFVIGICFAGLYVVIESWLNDRTESTHRGAIMSTYTFINFGVLIVGQLLLTTYRPSGFELFSVVAILLGLALVPVSLTTAPSPSQPENVRLDIRGLWRLSPVGFVGCLAVGLANGSFWTLGPIFASRSGLDIDNLVYFMIGTTLAGALMQWPLGRLSDVTDRRFIIIGTGICAVVAGILLSAWPEPSTTLLIILASVYGGVAMPPYAVSVAHANDFAEDDSFVATAGGLLLVYGIGAAAGPLIASRLMQYLGTGGLFLFTTVVHGGLVVFTILRVRIRAAPAQQNRSDFVAVPQTSPMLYEMDPRSEAETE